MLHVCKNKARIPLMPLPTQSDAMAAGLARVQVQLEERRAYSACVGVQVVEQGPLEASCGTFLARKAERRRRRVGYYCTSRVQRSRSALGASGYKSLGPMDFCGPSNSRYRAKAGVAAPQFPSAERVKGY